MADARAAPLPAGRLREAAAVATFEARAADFPRVSVAPRWTGDAVVANAVISSLADGGGAGAIVTVAVWARIFPVLRTTRTFDPPDELLDTPPEEKLQEQMP